MYKRILVALENGPSDKHLLAHVSDLARLMKSRVIVLHVAEGFVARNFDQLKLAESQEMKEDRAYLERTRERLAEQGIDAEMVLALGNPPTQIIRVAEESHCDLIAMGGHGHNLIGDIFRGSTIEPVRHKTAIPLLLVREKPKRKKK